MGDPIDPSPRETFVNQADTDRRGIEPWWFPLAAIPVYFAIRLLRGIPTDAMDLILGLGFASVMAVLFLLVDRWYARRR